MVNLSEHNVLNEYKGTVSTCGDYFRYRAGPADGSRAGILTFVLERAGATPMITVTGLDKIENVKVVSGNMKPIVTQTRQSGQTSWYTVELSLVDSARATCLPFNRHRS